MALAGLHGSATQEFSPAYPDLDDMPRLLEAEYDVRAMVELDSNPEYALELIENICSASSVTVMVYSAQVYPEMLVALHAGRRAREYLTQPITASTMAEAMVRASEMRNPAVRAGQEDWAGKLLVFVGAKGGSGSDDHDRQRELCGGPGAATRAAVPCCSI